MRKIKFYRLTLIESVGKSMKPGKISEPILKRAVLKTIKYKREEVLAGAAPGMDAAVLAGNVVVSSAVSGLYLSEPHLQFDCKCGLHNAMNNVYAKGGRPYAVLLNIVLPAGKLESDLRDLMGYLSKLCAKLQIQIAGGTTEVSRVVKQPVVTFTVLGKQSAGYPDLHKACKPGMQVVMTKQIGIMGTMMLLKEEYSALAERFPKSFLNMAAEMEGVFSVGPDVVAAEGTGVVAMHDVSRGGIFSALWELAEVAGMGIEARISDIPVRQETIEFCELFGLNPYKLISGGALLLVCENGEELAARLQRQGILATVIGQLRDDNDKVVIQNGEYRYLEPPKSDELYKMALK